MGNDTLIVVETAPKCKEKAKQIVPVCDQILLSAAAQERARRGTARHCRFDFFRAVVGHEQDLRKMVEASQGKPKAGGMPRPWAKTADIVSICFQFPKRKEKLEKSIDK